MHIYVHVHESLEGISSTINSNLQESSQCSLLWHAESYAKLCSCAAMHLYTKQLASTLQTSIKALVVKWGGGGF